MIVRRILNALLFGLLGFSTVVAFSLQNEKQSKPVVHLVCENQNSKFVLSIFDQGSFIKGRNLHSPEVELDLKITRAFKDLRIEIFSNNPSAEIFSKHTPSAEIVLKDAQTWEQIIDRMARSVMRDVYNSLPYDAVVYSSEKPNEAEKYQCNLRTKI